MGFVYIVLGDFAIGPFNNYTFTKINTLEDELHNRFSYPIMKMFLRIFESMNTYQISKIIYFKKATMLLSGRKKLYFSKINAVAAVPTCTRTLITDYLTYNST